MSISFFKCLHLQDGKGQNNLFSTTVKKKKKKISSTSFEFHLLFVTVKIHVLTPVTNTYAFTVFQKCTGVKSTDTSSIKWQSKSKK